MLGKILFYILWPLVWVYSPVVRRVRVVVRKDNQVLLVKNWFGPGYWQLPGGGIKMGESVVGATRRELDEELKITAKEVKSVHESPVIVKQFGLLLRYHFVLVDYDKNDFSVNRSITDAQWQDIAKLYGIAKEVQVGLDLVAQQR